MKTYLVQLICWGGLLTVLSACRSKEPEVVGAIIETAIPNGLVPGSALTLKGRDFGAVTSVQFTNTSVVSGQFMRTETNELTVKVPIGTQAGDVRVAGEKGPGQPKTMALLTGGYGLTADNVSTNLNTVTQGTFSDDCSPSVFLFCYKGGCIEYRRDDAGTTSSGRTCITYYTIERIAGADYEVFKPRDINRPQVVLKFEKSSNGIGYTGLVRVEAPNKDNYMGSQLKDGSIVVYSLKDGSELKLCKPNLAGSGIDPRFTLQCPANGCTACQ